MNRKILPSQRSILKFSLIFLVCLMLSSHTTPVTSDDLIAANLEHKLQIEIYPTSTLQELNSTQSQTSNPPLKVVKENLSESQEGVTNHDFSKREYATFISKKNALSNHELFLPLLFRQYVPYIEPRPLGNVTLLSGPDDCNGEDCYLISVDCPQLQNSIQATIKAGGPTISTYNGTIVFASGWTGTYFWENGVLNDMLINNLEIDSPEDIYAIYSNRNILDNLQAGGFQTIQVRWESNWFFAKPGYPEGMANLACRPATVIKWIHDSLPLQYQQEPFCATGHSNGASQLGYALTQYGLSSVLNEVVMESGPNWSRIDQSCLHTDSILQDLFADPDERSVIDWGFGYQNNGNGPCAQQDISYQSNFEEASLSLGSWSYNYPNTLVSFIFGGNDNGTTASHGKHYYNQLLSSGSPQLAFQIVPGAPHFVTETPAGATAMQNALLDGCNIP